MKDFLSRIAENKGLTIGLSVASVVMLLGSIALIPWLVARAPVDYFVRERSPADSAGKLALRVLKNVLGLVAVVLGVLMLILPGQGVLMIVIGLSVLDVPGKRKLMAALVRRDSVKRALDWLRRRAHKPPFELP